MKTMYPCLWFDNQAEEAMNFYASVFPHSRVLDISRYGKSAPMPEGTVLTVMAELNGAKVMALNGGPAHYGFTEAISLLVNCDDQAEVDTLWEKLSEGGQQGPCGWLRDKYGLSWQIVPIALGEMLADKDAARSQRVMEAMLKMSKLDIAVLRQAYEGR
jgi:predicted 3-demethylubiquinone-9 3-methyltransferase (glyoxalase superfamily)